MRKSPPTVLQPVIGSPGPPSATPTEWAPWNQAWQACGCHLLLLSRWQRHQDCNTHPENGPDKPEAHAPRQCGMRKVSAKEEGCDNHRQQPNAHDRATHDAEHGGIKLSGEIEVARRATRSLQGNECHLQPQAYGNSPTCETHKHWAIGDCRQQHPECAGVNQNRHRKLQGLHPRRYAGDQAWINDKSSQRNEHRNCHDPAQGSPVAGGRPRGVPVGHALVGRSTSAMPNGWERTAVIT